MKASLHITILVTLVGPIMATGQDSPKTVELQFTGPVKSGQCDSAVHRVDKGSMPLEEKYVSGPTSLEGFQPKLRKLAGNTWALEVTSAESGSLIWSRRIPSRSVQVLNLLAGKGGEDVAVISESDGESAHTAEIWSRIGGNPVRVSLDTSDVLVLPGSDVLIVERDDKTEITVRYSAGGEDEVTVVLAGRWRFASTIAADFFKELLWGVVFEPVDNDCELVQWSLVVWDPVERSVVGKASLPGVDGTLEGFVIVEDGSTRVCFDDGHGYEYIWKIVAETPDETVINSRDGFCFEKSPRSISAKPGIYFPTSSPNLTKMHDFGMPHSPREGELKYHPGVDIVPSGGWGNGAQSISQLDLGVFAVRGGNISEAVSVRGSEGGNVTISTNPYEASDVYKHVRRCVPLRRRDCIEAGAFIGNINRDYFPEYHHLHWASDGSPAKILCKEMSYAPVEIAWEDLDGDGLFVEARVDGQCCDGGEVTVASEGVVVAGGIDFLVDAALKSGSFRINPAALGYWLEGSSLWGSSQTPQMVMDFREVTTKRLSSDGFTDPAVVIDQSRPSKQEHRGLWETFLVWNITNTRESMAMEPEHGCWCSRRSKSGDGLASEESDAKYPDGNYTLNVVMWDWCGRRYELEPWGFILDNFS